MNRTPPAPPEIQAPAPIITTPFRSMVDRQRIDDQATKAISQLVQLVILFGFLAVGLLTVIAVAVLFSSPFSIGYRVLHSLGF